MNTSHLTGLLYSVPTPPPSHLASPRTTITFSNSGIALCVADPTNRRLLEAASVQLDLRPTLLPSDLINLDDITGFELIVADEPAAHRIRDILAAREENAESINPAVIVVVPPPPETASAFDPHIHLLDGLIALPQAPAAIHAQLSLFLYAHRSFAQRLSNRFEELQLNRSIFRSVTSGICVANAQLPDLPLTYVNPAFEVMTGYSLEEIQGRNCRFLQGSDTIQPGLTLVREAIHTQREITVVLRNFRKDGTPFWNELCLSPIRNRDGLLTHFVGIQNDVTARIEFEAALRESEKLAVVGRLASSIAHEINNPLEAVMNLIYLAQQADDFDEAKGYLATADRELQRVKLITSQSLRFFKQSTRPTAIGCAELFASVLDLYHSRLANYRVTIHRRDRSTGSIICMESEIRQVLHNLMTNAIDAMRRHGGRLLIRTRDATEWRAGAHGVIITIADTGAGIDPTIIHDIYKAFYTTKGIGGTGLGLWISSEIVTRHHGRLLVRSRSTGPHTGTVFQLFLPSQAIPL